MFDKLKRYKSRYIIDVVFDEHHVELVDSSNCSYYVDVDNKKLMQQFDVWFKTVFLKGTNNFLLVFECHHINNDGQIDVIVDELCNFETQRV